MSFPILFDWPPSAAKRKKRFSGTPRTLAKDYVLCTPVKFFACDGKRFFGDLLVYPSDV
jgi:hypothetical protein